MNRVHLAVDRRPGRQVAFIFLIALGIYSFMLPIWIHVDAHWGRGIASGASAVGLPLAGVPGKVGLKPARTLQFEYTLPDPRTGGRLLVPQRLLNVPDVPLAMALALSLLGLGWRRRVLLALGITALLYVLHVSLLTISAHRATTLLARTELSGEDLNQQLAATMNGMNLYGDLLVVVVVALTALGWYWLRERAASAPA